MKSTTLILLAVFCSALCADELTTAQAAFEKKKAAALRPVILEHLRALTDLEKRAQKAGDYDAALKAATAKLALLVPGEWNLTTEGASKSKPVSFAEKETAGGCPAETLEEIGGVRCATMTEKPPTPDELGAASGSAGNVSNKIFRPILVADRSHRNTPKPRLSKKQ